MRFSLKEIDYEEQSDEVYGVNPVCPCSITLVQCLKLGAVSLVSVHRLCIYLISIQTYLTDTLYIYVYLSYSVRSWKKAINNLKSPQK